MNKAEIQDIVNRLYNTEKITVSERREIESALSSYLPFRNILMWIFSAVIALIVLIAFMFIVGFITRHYDVWAMEMSGKAKLAESTQSRQIQVEQAKAEKEAAVFMADAISVVGEATKNYPEYRQQMYIQAFAEALTGGKINQIMYIPTEAGIPILEATRLRN